MNLNGGMLDFARSSKKHACAYSPFLSLLSCLWFQKRQGSFWEPRGRPLYPDLKQFGNHHWGTWMYSDAVSRLFSCLSEKAAVRRREGEAWHRPSWDFRGEEGRKGDKNALQGSGHLWRSRPQPFPYECGIWISEAPWWMTRSAAVGSTTGRVEVAMTSFVPTSLLLLVCVCTLACM